MRKKIINILLIPIACMVIGYLLLVLVNMISNKWIEDEVKQSAEILAEQGIYSSGYLEGWFLDNWTDADAISICINKNGNNPFYNALDASQANLKDSGLNDGVSKLQMLTDNNWDMTEDHSYLWHGHRIWLKILLIKYNITEIRMLTYLLTIGLSSFLCILLTRIKNSIWAFVPFLASFSFFNFQMESLSLLFFNDIFIMLIACIAVIWLCATDKVQYSEEMFASTGALVAFSSMLIMPPITLGFPLIIFLLITNTGSAKENINKLIKNSFAWTCGYGITMISKIILSKIIIKSNAGKARVIEYTGKEAFTIVERLEQIKNVFIRVIQRSQIEFDLAIIITIILGIYIIIKKKNNIKKLANLWPLLLIAFIPCVWCFVCVIHAFHGWTQWDFSISIFAILQVLWEICDFKNICVKRKDC